MKKTIALMLAMLFALCAFATTAFAETTTTTTTTEATDPTTTTTKVVAGDDMTDGFDTTTTTKAAETSSTTKGAEDSSTTTKAAEDSSTTTKAETTTELVGTLAPGQTAYEGQGDENKTTTKKPAAVDTTIPSTGSGIVVPAIALAVLAAGTVAVIKTKKEG